MAAASRTPWLLSLALLGGLGLAMRQNADLKAQIDSLEAFSEPETAAVVTPPEPVPRYPRERDETRAYSPEAHRDTAEEEGEARETETLDALVEDRVEEALEDRREERHEQREASREEIGEKIFGAAEIFAQENRIDGATLEAIQSILREGMEDRGTLHEELREGEVEHGDAHAEFADIRQDENDQLDDLIGEELREELRGELHGALGSPHGGRGRP